MHYLADPDAIMDHAAKTIRAEIDLSAYPPYLRGVVARLVYACGDSSIADDLRWGGDVRAATVRALAAPAPRLIIDSRMVRAGIAQSLIPSHLRILGLLDAPDLCARQKALATTRSAAGMDAVRDHLGGALVVIGNAPTALFHLLTMLETLQKKPAALFAFPVGYTGAAESKQALIERAGTIPYITLCGRRGGSPLAAAALNASLPSGPITGDKKLFYNTSG
ncbi:MAG: precorrin-8X methylmutase [Pseudomonadota bacterium]